VKPSLSSSPVNAPVSTTEPEAQKPVVTTESHSADNPAQDDTGDNSDPSAGGDPNTPAPSSENSAVVPSLLAAALPVNVLTMATGPSADSPSKSNAPVGSTVDAKTGASGPDQSVAAPDDSPSKASKPVSHKTPGQTLPAGGATAEKSDSSAADPAPASKPPTSASLTPAPGSENGPSPPADSTQKATADAGNPSAATAADGSQPASGTEAATYGTPAAQQDSAMKKAEKTTKSAGSAEQDLPVGLVSAAREQRSHTFLPVSATHDDSADAASTAATSSATRSSEAVLTSVPATVSSVADSDPRLRNLERTHDLIAMNSLRLRSSGSDSLSVVIKPSADVQLSLELTLRGNSIEARATLNHGDYDFLNRHWADLQQRLEPRGVQLGSLASGENSSGNSAGFNQSRDSASAEDPALAGGLAGFAGTSSGAGSTASRNVRSTAHRGWETWA
jgi:hypothetical protein